MRKHYSEAADLLECSVVMRHAVDSWKDTLPRMGTGVGVGVGVAAHTVMSVEVY